MAVVINRQHYYNHRTYTVGLHGAEIAVTVTAFASVVEEWLRNTLFLYRDYLHVRQFVVGLGVDPPVDTLQLCVGSHCLIFQLARADIIPQSLRDFLGNRFCSFVGFWNLSCRRNLKSSKHGLVLDRDPVDLRLYELGLENDSVDEIVYKCLGFKVEQRKEISTSNWSEEYLNEDQVAYACVETYCAFLIGRIFKTWEYGL